MEHLKKHEPTGRNQAAIVPPIAMPPGSVLTKQVSLTVNKVLNIIRWETFCQQAIHAGAVIAVVGRYCFQLLDTLTLFRRAIQMVRPHFKGPASKRMPPIQPICFECCGTPFALTINFQNPSLSGPDDLVLAVVHSQHIKSRGQNFLSGGVEVQPQLFEMVNRQRIVSFDKVKVVLLVQNRESSILQLIRERTGKFGSKSIRYFGKSYRNNCSDSFSRWAVPQKRGDIVQYV